jgi:hypothetical protein
MALKMCEEYSQHPSLMHFFTPLSLLLAFFSSAKEKTLGYHRKEKNISAVCCLKMR